MKLSVLQCLSLFSICLLSICLGEEFKSHPGVATGSSSGTYVKIGEDIARIIRKGENKQIVNVMVTSGSQQNLDLLVSDENVHFGIVQSDILYSFKKDIKGSKDDNVRNKVTIVTPLYNEELHILVRKDTRITSLSDLTKSKVFVGSEKGGTTYTAEAIYESLNLTTDRVDWRYKYGSFKEGLKMLDNAEVDAIFSVAGSPSVSIRNALQSGKYRLIGFDDEWLKFLPAFYSLEEIDSKSGYGSINTLKTLGVPSLLVTTVRNDDKQWVDVISSTICVNLNDLKDPRNAYHSKWKSLNLDSYKGVEWHWAYHPVAKKIIKDNLSWKWPKAPTHQLDDEDEIDF